MRKDGMHMGRSHCRSCGSTLEQTFVDLGMSPLANSYIKPEQRNRMEPFYPLHVYVCRQCLLVQLEEFTTPHDIFSDYAYFSSFSDSWLAHAKAYVDMIAERFSLGRDSRVIEIASNDGYLLQNFVTRGIPALGVEPAANVAEAAKKKGINTKVVFFGEKTARDIVAEGWAADLIIGNNVLAHVPDLNDFVRGLKLLLKPAGLITMEFPHLLQLMEQNQFDTIYHEHFSYFSFLAVEQVFARHGMKLFDVEELSTHGGSLRIYAAHQDDASKPIGSRAKELKAREETLGFGQHDHYLSFGPQVEATKRKLLSFLISAKQEGKRVVGYGAPAKGNTLLNYCGVRTDFLDYTVDRNPHKQGCFLPGVRIPIYGPERIRDTKPDYLLILPWNIREEIMQQMNHIREWGGKFVVPIPEVKVYS
ncbi:MAG: class I SAM-dependent methyltransferase [Nitrospira sp.]|nr:class I SAM-dependent methyltransferase [Nitrospira sp.]MDH4242845.1 class I SAM-dependent methyltransferase [Nitrospira sp.]MDH4355904.1 class I SAM-dependent methyltransferase [Nitrospira sp.]MDH5317881.1 class I SAM-dependent methyltransferase [Nitrospira sp.]